MIEDVYEPLVKYRDEFKEKFAILAKQKFQELVKKSGIDVKANRRQVGIIESLQTTLTSARSKRALFCFLMIIGYVGAIVGIVVSTMNNGTNDRSVIVLSVIGAFASFGIAIWLTVLFNQVGDVVNNLEKKVDEAMKIAWSQMAPLNRLYTWDITTNLIQETVPRLAFDPFFSSQRLSDLKRIYGWDDSFNDERSIVFAQSGVINGNPFLIGEYLEMEWGMETYTGSMEIQWEEAEEDEDGDVHYVTRYQTLTASIDRPIPRYSKQKVLIYGNDAAPSLSFSRHPSGLSNAEDGIITSIRKKWRLSRLKSLSRDIDNSNFRLMSNHEFETIFNCRDRDNEVEFRLLYTALAQTQTLNLLKDKDVGFGDDFSIIKRKKLNFILSKHLNDANIDTAPQNFHHWHFDNARQNFSRFNQQYFKDVYFALAPLLAIPLYQQTRTHEDIWKGVSYTDPSSFWEHEAMANYYGDAEFEHPDCITKNILKTQVVSREDGASRIHVTAYGFRGEARLDYESVRGGDGLFHDIPIEWVEYLPVEKTSEMIISEGYSPSQKFSEAYRTAAHAVNRRFILSFIPGGKRNDGCCNELPSAF